MNIPKPRKTLAPKSKETALRDYFAAAAMPLAMRRLKENYNKSVGDWEWDEGDWAGIAEHAYALADAMLEERE